MHQYRSAKLNAEIAAEETQESKPIPVKCICCGNTAMSNLSNCSHCQEPLL